jgi:N4-gp56 family major capsid protein
VSRISGRSLQNIVKAVGSAGTADPLNQRGTSGWKASLAAKILQQLFMVRLEHAV